MPLQQKVFVYYAQAAEAMCMKYIEAITSRKLLSAEQKHNCPVGTLPSYHSL